MKLIIVESPTKAKTISSFLDKSYEVISSYGHVRDLPKSKLGINVENDFSVHYVIPTKVRKKVSELKKIGKKANEIILATDEDREGEAIAWHLSYILDMESGKEKRIVFHEITKDAITKALKSPRKIDMDMVNAQQARRALDRLVGYKLSPFLWKKIARGLSAGRVQSVTLRIIVEKEREIEAFIKKEYWEIHSNFYTQDKNKKFVGELSYIDGKKIVTETITNENTANEIVKDLRESNYIIKNIERKSVRKNPPPPFITSTLQQEAYKRLRFSSKQTMRLAQSLYEAGLITYMRTDSLNLSKQSTDMAKKWLSENVGKEYILDAPRIFKKKSKNAQEAHEAIRPTNPLIKSLENNKKIKEDKERSLYELIWQRFIASQMPQAIFENTRILVNANGEKEYTFTTNGSVVKFDGFLRIWKSKYSENTLPNINKTDSIFVEKIETSQHFTQPPARYNEASLIKTLEEYGIGRPSTYSPIIYVIQQRNYVIKNEQRRFEPTDIGIKVNDILVKHFENVVNIDFTADMEKKLDEISEGKKDWKKIIKDFYVPFEKNLEEKLESVKSQIPKEEKTDIKCDKCGKPMVIKFSRFGRFMACSGFPECKNTKSLPEENGGAKKKTFGKCPECKDGKIILKRTKKHRFFYGCSNYPDCEYASWKKPKTENDENNEK